MTASIVLLHRLEDLALKQGEPGRAIELYKQAVTWRPQDVRLKSASPRDFEAFCKELVNQKVDEDERGSRLYKPGPSYRALIAHAAWKKGRDQAYQEAMAELIPSFIQCPRCNVWVCRERFCARSRTVNNSELMETGPVPALRQSRRSSLSGR